MDKLYLFVLGAGIIVSVVAAEGVNKLDQNVNAVVLDNNATCNSKPLESCLLTFFANFGFGGRFPSNESVFDDTLHQYVIKNGTIGWAQVQLWMKELYSCVGGQPNFDQCIHWQQYMVLFNMTETEAMNWEARYRTLEYQVGAGYNVLTQNWYCINQVDQHEEPNIRKCRDTFNSEQHNQPNMTCQHVSEYLVCIQRPYARNCGQVVGAFACSYERIIYQVTHPECTDHVALHCQGSPSPTPLLFQRKNAKDSSLTMLTD